MRSLRLSLNAVVNKVPDSDCGAVDDEMVTTFYMIMMDNGICRDGIFNVLTALLSMRGRVSENNIGRVICGCPGKYWRAIMPFHCHGVCGRELRLTLSGD